jgi:hypothetical protein
MVKEKKNKRYVFIITLTVFMLYMLLLPRPIPQETVIKPRWISSLETGLPITLGSPNEEGILLPFTIGEYFGYLRENGEFAIKKNRSGLISISQDYWAEYEGIPSSIELRSPLNENVFTIEKPLGYPLFLDNRVFIVGNEQNSITALDNKGEALWIYDFPAPLTCVDAAGGYFLAGTLDGTVVVLGSSGLPVFTPFEPGGSRLSVILGCAVSADASRFALISGIDEQRFLLLERSGDSYKVVYHEFLYTGFRRPVLVSFIDNDSKIAFEREEGLGIYNTVTRNSAILSLDGEVAAIDNSGENGFLFVISSQGATEKRFISISYPAFIVNEAPFKSRNVFLARTGNKLYLGGDKATTSCEKKKK